MLDLNRDSRRVIDIPSRARLVLLEGTILHVEQASRGVEDAAAESESGGPVRPAWAGPAGGPVESHHARGGGDGAAGTGEADASGAGRSCEPSSATGTAGASRAGAAAECGIGEEGGFIDVDRGVV